MYLIRAEAKTHLNDLPGATDDINMTRLRAGLGKLSVVDITGTINAIMKERQAELFCEWGNRWFDLKRTNAATAVLSPVKPFWKSTAVLYPVPVTEINTNPNLTQNAGY